jgi:predicted enzyme related to lactoylglutathione lyase
MNLHEKINYLEFPAKDIEATKTFFTQVFSWSFVDYGPEYTAFSQPHDKTLTDAENNQKVEESIGGGFFQSDLCSSTKNGSALTVFYSNDLEQTQSKIEQAKGTIIEPIFTFPGGRRFHFSDPNGNEFAVWSDKV